MLIANVVTLAPDRQLALIGSTDGTLLAWDVVNNRLIKQWEGHAVALKNTPLRTDLAQINDIAISNDGRRAVTASSDDHLIVWDLEALRPARWLVGHTDDVLEVEIAPDGQYALSRALGTIIWWDIITGMPVHEITSEEGIFSRSLGLNPDGTLAFAGLSLGEPSELVVWNTNTWEEIVRVPDVEGGVFSQDGTRFLGNAVDGSVVLLDTKTWDVLYRYGEDETRLALGFGENTIFTRDRNFSQIQQWQLDGTEPIARLDSVDDIWDTSVFSDEEIMTIALEYLNTVNAISADIQISGADWDFVLSPDGTRLYTMSNLSIPQTLDTTTGEILLTFEEAPTYVSNLALSPDGATLYTLAREGGVLSWDTETGVYIKTIASEQYLTSFMIGPNGNLLLQPNIGAELLLIDVTTEEIIQRYPSEFGNYTTIAMDQSSTYVAAGMDDGTLLVWDKERGELRDSITTEVDRITALAFAPHSEQLAPGTLQGYIQVWDLSLGNLIHTYEGPGGEIYDLLFSPDGRWLISAERGDVAVKIWNTQDQQAPIIPGPWLDARKLALNGRALFGITNGGTIGVIAWQPRNIIRQVEAPHGGTLTKLKISPDGTRIFGLEVGWGGVILDLDTKETFQGISSYDFNNPFLTVSPDGRYVAAGGYAKLALVDAQSGENITPALDTPARLDVAGFSPNGEHMFGSLANGDILEWDTLSGAEIRLLPGNYDDFQLAQTEFVYATDMAVSADGEWLALGKTNGVFEMWNLDSGTRQYSLQLDIAGINGLTFSPDSTMVATAGEDRRIQLWDVASGTLIRNLTGHTDGVNALIFHANGTRLYSASCAVRLSFSCPVGELLAWDVASGQVIQRFVGHYAEVTAVDVTPDGTTLVSSDTNGIIFFWALESANAVISTLTAQHDIVELTCLEREVYAFDPGCDENGVFPFATPAAPPVSTSPSQ